MESKAIRRRAYAARARTRAIAAQRPATPSPAPSSRIRNGRSDGGASSAFAVASSQQPKRIEASHSLPPMEAATGSVCNDSVAANTPSALRSSSSLNSSSSLLASPARRAAAFAQLSRRREAEACSMLSMPAGVNVMVRLRSESVLGMHSRTRRGAVSNANVDGSNIFNTTRTIYCENVGGDARRPPLASTHSSRDSHVPCTAAKIRASREDRYGLIKP